MYDRNSVLSNLAKVVIVKVSGLLTVGALNPQTFHTFLLTQLTPLYASLCFLLLLRVSSFLLL